MIRYLFTYKKGTISVVIRTFEWNPYAPNTMQIKLKLANQTPQNAMWASKANSIAKVTKRKPKSLCEVENGGRRDHGLLHGCACI